MNMKLYRNACTQGPMHPAPTGDFQKPATLARIQVTYQLDGPVNGVKLSQCGFFTKSLLHLVYSVVAELDTDIP
jgi:hypothetical protein